MTSQDVLTKQPKISQIKHFALILFCLTQIYCSNPSVITDHVNPFVITDYVIPPKIKDFSVANEYEAWLVTQEGKVFHFTDRGEKVAQAEFSEKITQIDFLNANEGWALSERGQLWATTNGGNDWNIKSLFGDESIALHANRLIFADNKVGWLTGNFTIWMTEDGGASWNMVYPTEQLSYATLKGQPVSISAVNADVVWLGFSGGAVLKTTDRGKNWERLASPGNYDLQALKAFNADESFVSGWNGGGLFHTTDGGKTWRQTSPPEFRRKSGIQSISFTGKKDGWAAGLNFVDSPDSTDTDLDVLLKTADGGKTWTKIETGIKEPHGFKRVEFSDDKNGWLLGESTVYHTADGGNSWIPIFKVNDNKDN